MPAPPTQAIYDLITPQAHWLLVALTRTVDAPEPATSTLRRLKGSAFLDARQGAITLRGICGSPNRYMTMLHAADDWVEVIREAWILLGPDAGTLWLATLCGSERVDSMAPAPVAGPVRIYDLLGSVRRVRAALAASRRVPAARTADARLALALRTTGPVDAARFLADLAPIRKVVDDWDLAVILSALAAD